MANKAISELPQAQNVNNQDLFVLEQSGIAKKLTAETFITEQGIIDALAEALDGHGGIQSVTLSSVSGRIRTYLITFTDQSATTFQVYDGTTITSIRKTSSSGLVDVYTIYMSDGTTSFFQVRNGQDGSATWDQINSKAPIITETVTGVIANFPDGADDIPVAGLVVNIEPVQSGSGDPSPSNIRPITGWTGCNVTRTGANLLDDNGYSITGEAGVNKSYYSGLFVYLIAGQTYTFAARQAESAGTQTRNLLFVYKQDTTTPLVYESNNSATAHVHYVSYTPTVSGYYSLGWWAHTLGTAVTLDQFCVGVGSSVPTYAIYQSTTLTVDWTSEAGTVYGGSLDVTTGVLTVTDGYIASYNGETLPSTWISDRDVYAAGTTPTIGAQVVYKLATTQTYQLTPQQLNTLLGTNNIFSDCSSVEVEYRADTKLYIEKLTMPTEDDMTANQAITSGKFFMVGNNLYIATAAIASGAKIIEGTNATRLSLADALNRL